MAGDIRPVQETNLTMQSPFRKNRKLVLGLAIGVPTLMAATAVVATATPAPPAHKAKVTTRFASPSSYKTHPAVTYDQKSVPLGSRVQVSEKPNNKGGMIVTLKVAGLNPNTDYDAHVHAHPCSANPADSGGHVQNGPSTEAYEQNEVWLNFKTNRHGKATSQSAKYWTFEPHQANSVVIHSHATKARLACITVPFK
jgi:Cu-Zn family superoxide dismutase